MEKRIVIFCNDGYPSIGLIRSLGEANYRPECYCYGKYCRYLLASKYVSKGRIFETPDEVLNYLVNDYPLYGNKPILFTVPDLPAFLVDQNYNRLSQKFLLMSAGRQGAIGEWMDKRKMANIAKKHGFTIPWTIELSKNDTIPESIEYPVFTKSIRSVDGGKCDESICWNRDELEAKKTTIQSERFLVMKYIKKKQEIDYFGLSVKGKAYINFHDEISRFPNSGYGYYCVYKKCDHTEICQRCISMIEEIGYNGLFDVEFLKGEDGVLYFMEMNYRVDGAIYKLTPGINLPAEWCRLVNYDKKDLPEVLPIKKEHFTGMTELQDFKTSVLSGEMNFFKWFWEFCTADTHMLLNLKDPKPVFVWAFDFIRGSVRKMAKQG